MVLPRFSHPIHTGQGRTLSAEADSRLFRYYRRKKRRVKQGTGLEREEGLVPHLSVGAGVKDRCGRVGVGARRGARGCAARAGRQTQCRGITH